MKFVAPLIAILLGRASSFSPTTGFVVTTTVSTRSSDILSMSSTGSSDSLDNLKDFQAQSNPLLKYWDPLNLVSRNFWDQGDDATIGFLRQSEIKHGRIAMAAFVGYCVQSNYVFSWPQTLSGQVPSLDMNPEAQWDAIPFSAKLQILLVIGSLEIWDECGGRVEGSKHYMKGGKPGDYPSFSKFAEKVHPVLNLYDPFNLSKDMTDEDREKRLVMEVNNGRLAMIGIFGFLAADAVPGSVPALAGIARPYDGNVMIPFSGDFSLSAESAVGWVTGVAALTAVSFLNYRQGLEVEVEEMIVEEMIVDEVASAAEIVTEDEQPAEEKPAEEAPAEEAPAEKEQVKEADL